MDLASNFLPSSSSLFTCQKLKNKSVAILRFLIRKGNSLKVPVSQNKFCLGELAGETVFARIRKQTK